MVGSSQETRGPSRGEGQLRMAARRGALTRKFAEGDRLFLHTPEGRLVLRLRRLDRFAERIRVELRFLRGGRVAFLDLEMTAGQHFSFATADGPLHVCLVRLRGLQTSQSPRAILRFDAPVTVRIDRALPQVAGRG